MTYYAKLWTDIVGDEKLMRAARKGSKGLELLPWFIAFAKKADDGGRLSVNGEAAEPDDIAAGIPGVNAKRVHDAEASLVSIGILTADDDGVLRFAKWQKRNWMAPSDTPEEVKKRVDKHRAAKRGVTTRETMPVTTPETGSETTARSRDLDLDKDKDKDKDKDADSSSTRARAALTAAANRGIRERYGEQPNPIRHDAGTSHEAFDAIVAAQVPLDFARDAIFTCAAHSSAKEPPRTLKYFTKHVLDRWAAQGEHAAAASSDAKALPAGVTGSGRSDSVSFVAELEASKRG